MKLEDLVISRGKKAIAGKIDPWDLPEFAPTIENIRTEGARNLEDVGSAIRKSDVRGPAAGTMLEKVGETNEGSILNLANQLRTVPEAYIAAGTATEQAAENRKLEEMKALVAAREARKGRKVAEHASSPGGQLSKPMSGMCCINLFELGCLTDQVRTVRDSYFDPNGYVAKGYMKMGEWLAPILRRHKEKNTPFYRMMRVVMGLPIAKYSDYRVKKDHRDTLFVPFCLFWTGLWSGYGRIDLIGKPVVEWRNPLLVKKLVQRELWFLYVPPIMLKALWMHRVLRKLRGKKRVL